MADKPTFNFAGGSIPFVGLDEITVDESVVLYNWSGLTMDKVLDLDGFHQGFTAGLLHISLARAKPNLSEKQIRDAVGAMKLMDMITAFDSVTVETDTPPPTIEPETSSENDGSGEGSSNGGDASQESNPDPLSGDRSLGRSLLYGPGMLER